MEILSFLFQVDQAYSHFQRYTKQLFTKLFNTGLNTIGVDIKHSNTFHTALLDCIRTGIECEEFNTIPSYLPVRMEPYFHSVDDATKSSSLKLMVVLIRKVLVIKDSQHKWDGTCLLMQCFSTSNTVLRVGNSIGTFFLGLH